MAARNTSWPEYCLSAIEELLSAVKEMHPEPNVQSHGVSPNGTFLQICSNTPSRSFRHTEEERSNVDPMPNRDSGETEWPNQTPATPVVLSSAGIVRKTSGRPAMSEEVLQRRTSDWPRMTSTLPGSPRSHHHETNQTSGTNQPMWSTPSAPPPLESIRTTTAGASDRENVYHGDLAPGGQESMAWYDQLFDSSFSALDNPFLAGAQFDSSIDPTWSYLT